MLCKIMNSFNLRVEIKMCEMINNKDIVDKKNQKNRINKNINKF